MRGAGRRRRAAIAIVVVALGGAGCGGAASAPPSAPLAADPLAELDGPELYRRGLALADAGDHVRAEQYLESAIARGHPEAVVLPALLRVCVASSRLRAALGHAEPYLEREPGAWSLRLLVASIYLGVGDVERARAALERVVVDAPAEPDPYYLLAVVLRDEVGDRPGAARRFAEYIARAPDGIHAREATAALKGLGDPPADPAIAPPPAAAPPKGPP